MRNSPEIVEVDSTQLADVLCRVEQSLDEKDTKLIRAVFESYVYVADLVEDKNTSIRRLRQLFFGKRTEKTKTIVGTGDGKAEAALSEATTAPDAAAATEIAAGTSDTDVTNTAPAGTGHGRNGAEYQRDSDGLPDHAISLLRVMPISSPWETLRRAGSGQVN